MALADTIQAVQSGKSPEEARIESVPQKTPFMERLLKSIKNIPENAVRKMAKIDKMDLPDDFNAAGGFAKNVYEQISEPIKAIHQRGVEKYNMPMKQSAIENAKDVGTIFKEVGKAAGRLGTSAIDAVQMAARNKVDPIDWEKIPVLKNIPSYQRQAELKAEAGMPLQEIIANATRDIALDTLTVYGSAKTLGGIDKKISGGAKIKPTKGVEIEMAPKTRMKVINDAIKSGDIKKSDVILPGKKTLANPRVVKGRLDDYVNSLTRETGNPAYGEMLRKRININNVHYRNGKFVEIDREVQRLLKDTKKVKAAEASAVAKSMQNPDFNYGVKRTAKEQAEAEKNMQSFQTQLDLEKKNLIQKK